MSLGQWIATHGLPSLWGLNNLFHRGHVRPSESTDIYIEIYSSSKNTVIWSSSEIIVPVEELYLRVTLGSIRKVKTHSSRTHQSWWVQFHQGRIWLLWLGPAPKNCFPLSSKGLGPSLHRDCLTLSWHWLSAYVFKLHIPSAGQACKAVMWEFP